MTCLKCNPHERRRIDLDRPRIAVLGMPNTGKSTFFNRLTGANASVGNWPGMTVDLVSAIAPLGNIQAEIVDLPGLYDLRGFSEDEAVVRRFLDGTALNLLIIILNANQLDRQLSLAIQARSLNLPALLLLNMADEASQFGVQWDSEAISAQLAMPVVAMSAKYGQGYADAYRAIKQQLSQHPQASLATRSTEALLPSDEDLALSLEKLLQAGVVTPAGTRSDFTSRLDHILLHPLLGLPLFFGLMFLMFQLVYRLGTPLQSLLAAALELIKESLLEPLLGGLPPFLHDLLLDGLYGGFGTVAAFMPVIALFFICMAIVEDSGYLSRSAYLMDAFMERLGLDGRSFVMSLMGFGCNIPAIMGLRVMRSPALRMLSMLVIPFSLCSARLNVFIFLTTALFSASMAPLVLFSLYLFSFAAAILTALVFKGKYPSQEPLVLELPPYRFPTLRQMLLRAWQETLHFLRFSWRFIVFGVVAIWLCNNLPYGLPPASPGTFSGLLGQATQPLLAPLGITPQLTVSLVFGFIAKEIVLGGLAVIYGSSSEAGLGGAIAAQIDWVQAYSFMLFTLLYVPCLSTVAVIKAESKSLKFASLSVVWSLGLAWVTSFVFYQGARALGF